MAGFNHSGEIFGVGYCCPVELHPSQHTSYHRGQPSKAFLPMVTVDPPFLRYMINASVK
jgi:hypothetical protein